MMTDEFATIADRELTELASGSTNTDLEQAEAFLP